MGFVTFTCMEKEVSEKLTHDGGGVVLSFVFFPGVCGNLQGSMKCQSDVSQMGMICLLFVQGSVTFQWKCEGHHSQVLQMHPFILEFLMFTVDVGS